MYHLSQDFKKRYKHYLNLIEKKKVNISGERLANPIDFRNIRMMRRECLAPLAKHKVFTDSFKKSYKEKERLKDLKSKCKVREREIRELLKETA